MFPPRTCCSVRLERSLWENRIYLICPNEVARWPKIHGIRNKNISKSDDGDGVRFFCNPEEEMNLQRPDVFKWLASTF